MNYIIETQGLSKKYGKNFVVDNVDMHILEGSVYGFVGENGSGKTTIMRLLMGLAHQSKGSYTLFGIQDSSKEIYKVRTNISAIVEAPSLVPTMTAEENLKFACMYYGIQDLSIVKEILKQVNLENTGKKKVKNFSLGMRQRLGIAVLLLNKPKLMLLDEPLNGLDPAGIAEVRDLIIKLNKQGITFLISSHILSELEKVATHYGFISKGKLLNEISEQELTKQCQKCIIIKHNDIEKIEKTLSKLGYSKVEASNIDIRIYDEVKPLEILTKLHKEGIEIDDIQTSEGTVEEYYLNLIKGVN